MESKESVRHFEEELEQLKGRLLAMGGLAEEAAETADQAGIQRWHNIPFHAFGALPVVAGAYWVGPRYYGGRYFAGYWRR